MKLIKGTVRLFKSIMPIFRFNRPNAQRTDESKDDSTDRSQSETESSDPMTVGKYQLDRKIGSGSFGSVYVCRDTHTKKKYAGKLFIQRKLKDSMDVDLILSEVDILKELQHKHTVSFVDLLFAPQGILLVMELVEGGEDLFDMVPVDIGLYESFAKVLFHQLLQAVDYIHSRGIAHRDIKVENVMVDKRGNVKLVDYGLAEQVSADILDTKGLIVPGVCGTEHCYAPELIETNCREEDEDEDEDEFFGDKVDIWALGVVLYEIVSGKRLFKGRNSEALCKRITALDIYQKHCDFSPELKDLLAKILQQDPIKRPSAKEMLNHPWMKSVAFENNELVSYANPSRTIALNLENRIPDARESCPRRFLRASRPYFAMHCRKRHGSIGAFRYQIDDEWCRDMSTCSSSRSSRTSGSDRSSESNLTSDRSSAGTSTRERKKLRDRIRESKVFSQIWSNCLSLYNQVRRKKASQSDTSRVS